MRGALLSQGTTPHLRAWFIGVGLGLLRLGAWGGPAQVPFRLAGLLLYSLSSEVQSVRLSRSSCMIRVESL